MKPYLWAALALAAAGCGAGDAPQPMSSDDLKAAVDKATPAQQVAWVKSSPMPAAEKAKRIKEIEDKTGYKDPATAQPASGR